MAGAATSLRAIAKRAQSLPRQWATAAAKDITKGIDKSLIAASGGDRSLSNAPVKLSVQSKVQGDTVVTATVAPGRRGMAQWSWLESGTQPHRIGAGMHPGTKGKRVWSKAATPALDRAVRDVRRRLGQVMTG